MKIKHLIVNDDHNLDIGWEIAHSEFDKKTKKFHVLLYDEQKPKERESAIGFELTSDNNS